MDRQILLAAMVAMALAATIKVVAPVETAAYTKMTMTPIPAVMVWPDTTWLVGP